jgi:hypothetical protein
MMHDFTFVITIIMIIIMKSSSDRDNNNRHYVIQRIAGFAITLYYHPAGLTLLHYKLIICKLYEMNALLVLLLFVIAL